MSLQFDWVRPSNLIIAVACDGVDSTEADVRDVSKALLDLIAEAARIQMGILADGSVDLAPYFDFWFADSIVAANRLLSHDEETIRLLAECLICQEQSLIESKESFLKSMHRLGIKRKRDA